MTTKNIQLFRKNLDTSETNLYPLTEAQYVSMENGQTVQEILSDRDSDKYTPVITNSSSTFKVGQGDNVDLSSSMKEGAYDSCMLKGKTMANCIQEPSSKDVVLPYEFADGQYVTINDTKESGALGVELKGQTLVNLVGEKREYNSAGLYGWEFMLPYKLTKDARYMVVFNASGTITDNSKVYLMDNGFDNNSGNTPYPVSFTLGYNKHITTASGDNHKVLRIRTGSQAVNDFKVSDVMLIPYQEGMENWDIPYFEGMTSCKMPTLHTVGKNLITQSFINTLCNLDNWEGTGAYRNNRKAGELLALFPSNSYVTQVPALTIPANFYPIIYLSYQDETSVSNGHILASGLYNNNTDSEMVCPERQWRFSVNSKNVVVRGYVNKWNQENMNKLKTVMTQNIQMETGTTTTTYEQGKSSILSLPEEVVLRSLPNGVCDTFNTRTGVYTQRIWSATFNGTESYSGWVSSAVAEGMTGIYTRTKVNDKIVTPENQDGQILCDTLPTIHRNQLASCQYDSVIKGNNYIGFTMKGKTSDEIKQWLSENPTTVYCELKTPIVTKINLPSTLKSWNTTTHIYSEIPENTLYPTLTRSNPTYPVILKPSTKYSIVANSYSNGHTNSAINFNLGGATASTTVGNRVTTITTPSTLTSEELVMSGRGNKLNNVMIIEGDVVGDEPYFEGICDCKSPILSNCGKNLFDEQRHSNPDNFFVHSAYWSIPIQLKGNTEYRFSYTFNNVFDKQAVMRFATCKWTSTDHSTHPYSLGQVFNRGITSNLIGKTESMSFVTPADGLVYLHYYNSELTNSPSSFNLASWYTHILKDIQLEESSTSTQYEPYQSNTTTFDQKDGKTIVLRSLPNGVCDTLNVETGEYVQRIGEVNTKSLQTTVNLSTGSEANVVFVNGINGKFIGWNECNVASDKLQWTYRADTNWSKSSSINGIAVEPNGGFWFIVDKTIETKEQANEFLVNLDATIQYELATPIVSTIDIQGFPYAYTNGHVQLSSGHSGQSLTPKVEYSLSANKTGQINSNTKRVSAHQKQLDDFEAMMLTQMVQSAYDKAILQFDYEMQMMSLGGE